MDNKNNQDESLWKDVPGMENIEAHPSGDLRNKTTKRIYLAKSIRHRYRQLNINVMSHRLVAATFLENDDPENKKQVNHKNGDKRDNRVENLEWITNSDNVKQVILLGRKNSGRNRSIKVIYQDGKQKIYESHTEAEKELEIKGSAIFYCIKHKKGEYTHPTLGLLKFENITGSSEEKTMIKPVKVEGFTYLDARSDGIIINRNTNSIRKGKSDGRYLRITSKETKKSTSIHRLIALTFIPNPDNKEFVNHINGITTDNRVENLEWVTHSENIKHAAKIGLIDYKKIGNDRKLDIYQLELDGNIIKQYDRKIDENINSIRDICCAYKKCKPDSESDKIAHSQFGGYGWCFVKDYTKPVVNKKFEKIFPELVDRKDINFDKIRKYVDSGFRPVVQRDLDGRPVKMWYSSNDIVEKVPNTSVTNIHNCIKSEGTLSAGGYFWNIASYDEILDPEFKSPNFIIPKIVKNALKIPDNETRKLKPSTVTLLRENITQKGDFCIKTLPIVQMDMQGNIIKYWSSPSVARYALNMGRSCIEGACSRNGSSGGFKWRYMSHDEMLE